MAKKEWISGAELARRMGISHQRVYRLVREGKLKRRKDKLLDFEKSKAIIEQGRLLDPNNVDEPATTDKEFETLTEARKAYEGFKARIAELDYLQRRGELLEAAIVIETCQKIISTVKAKILAVPAKLAPELVGIDSAKKAKALIEAELHEALNELSKMNDVSGNFRK